MSDIVRIERVDAVWIKVIAEPSIKMELSDHFTFKVPGAQFSPKYRMGYWDGKIRLLNVMTGRIYAGLVDEIIAFCKPRNYPVQLGEGVNPKNTFPLDIATKLNEKYKTPYEVRDYQSDAIYHALTENRSILLSPTASGKSFIIYLIARYHMSLNRKILIIVPTTALVDQMATDFVDYNNGTELSIVKIRGGLDKTLLGDITISTWQSLFKMSKEFFDKFDVVFGDEAHLFKAKSLCSIMEKMVHCDFRLAFTGTLDGSLTNEMVLNGLFGKTFNVVRTKKLMEDGHVAQFDIKAIVLEYPDEDKKLISGSKPKSYQEEIDWIVRDPRRNKYIRNLAWKLGGNGLILFQFVEKHGEVLYPLLCKSDKHKVHFIHGGISAEERERIRHLVDATDNNIINASYGSFSTGTNIKRLDWLIFASPSKGRIRNLQSIGRVLRIGEGSTHASLYDIVDNLQWKTRQNFAIRHFVERVKIYTEEGFKLKIFNVKL